MRIIDGIPVFGDPVDESALDQIKMCLETADKVALMGDHHQGYSCPIGGVVGYKNAVSPSACGFDIACGNKAVKLNVPASYVRENVDTIADQIFSQLSFGVGRVNSERVDHELFSDPLWDESDFFKTELKTGGYMKDLAVDQLGTIGSGNHYVDVFEDENDDTWVGVHFGSRGLGHKTATHFLKMAGAKDGIHAEPCVLGLDTDIGLDYWRHMELAGEYAYAGRDWVCDKVASIIGGDIVDEVHNHHNFAWKEPHGDGELIVVRKGATPAFPGQRGFVGGSMGDNSVILEGVDHDKSEHSLYSTVHGAGRVMSRTRAAGKTKWKKGQKIRVSEGEISRDMMHDWISPMGVTLRGAGTDESPHCYKRLSEVLGHHEGTVKILHTLKPLIVCMAPEGEFDPYKD